MTDFLKPLLELLRLSPRYFFTGAVICALLLFTEPGFLDALGIAEFVKEHRAWIGISFLVSTALWIVAIIVYLMDSAKKGWAAKRRKTQSIDRLNNLTENEKQILRYYIDMDTRSNVLRTDNGDVQALVHAGIIYLAARRGHIVEGFAHNISEHAWKYLAENPHVLEGTTDFYYTDKGRARIF